MDKKPPVLSRRLSGIDAAFLYLERKEIPLNIAAVGIFDGPIPVPRIRRQYRFQTGPGSALPAGRRAAAVQPRLSHLGVRSGFRHQAPHLPRAPGRARRRGRVARRWPSRLLSQMLDRGKPLWEIHVVDGLQDGRGALIVRIHHALADGVAGAALLKIMLDPTPKARAPPASREPARGSAAASSSRSPSRSAGAIQSALENVIAAEAGLLSLADGLLSDRGKSAFRNWPPCCRNCSSRPSASPSTSPARATACSAGPKSISARCRRSAPRWAAR